MTVIKVASWRGIAIRPAPGIITSDLSSGLECEDAGQGHQVGGSAVSVTGVGGAPPL